MDQKELRELERKCIQEEPPECTAACPIHVNVREFIRNIQDGKWEDAYKVLQKTMPFPGIIGRICDAPCMDRCRRSEVDDPVNIGALEKACVKNPAPRVKLPPSIKKDRRIAVIGVGLGSLTVALDLAKKGYRVSLFESGKTFGERLLKTFPDRLTSDIIAEELDILLRLKIDIQTGVEEADADFIKDITDRFDAVYIENDTFPLSTGENVFTSGDSTSSPIWQAARGRWAATSMDRYLQKVSMTAGREKEGPYPTRLFTNIKDVPSQSQIEPSSPRFGYTDEEAVKEARRCLLCECMECVKVCGYLEKFNAYPKKYAREIYNNESIVMGSRQANKLINSCSLCGLCEVVCPENFAMQDLCLTARQGMVHRGKMPPSAHEFALLDMAFSQSDKFTLCRHEPGFSESGHLFFPGCQLCASSPEQVFRVYNDLRKVIDDGIGLMLDCCSAPAYWAGRMEALQDHLGLFKKKWEDMGSPRLILACSTCYQMFKSHLADVSIVSLWEVLLEKEGLQPLAFHPSDKIAIHDPCTTRHEPKIHSAVRTLLKRLDIDFEELELSLEKTECCGFGGLMQNANPELAEKILKRRATENHRDYLTYCAMCRDQLSRVEKRAFYLLDLFYPQSKEPALRKHPGWSERRENRERLKERFLKAIWKEEISGGDEEFRTIVLLMSPQIEDLLEKRRILREDVQKVIEHAEKSGRKFYNENTGRFLASFKPFNATFWVEYSTDKNGYIIHNAYAHRMEAVHP